MNFRGVITLILLLCAGVSRAQTAWVVTTSKLTGTYGRGLYDVAYGNGRFVATLPYLAYTSAIWSEDGETWHPTSSSGPRYGGEILFTSERFFQLADAGLWQSTDGDQWQQVKAIKLHDELGHNHFASSGTTFMISVSAPDGTLLYTPDLNSFIATGPLPNTGQAGSVLDVSSVVYWSGRYYVHYFVLTSGGYFSYVAATADNRTWTLVSALNGATSFIAGGNRLLAIVGSNLISSTDGVAFTSRPAPSALFNARLHYEGGRFFGGEKLLASTDGITWAPLGPLSYPPESGLPHLTYGNGRFIAVGTVPGSSGSFSNTDFVALLDTAGPPTISRQPQSVSVSAGQAATLTAVAAGGGLSYQWSKDGVNLPGATTSTFQWGAVTTADAGTYRVKVSNSWDSVISSGATVTVTAANPARLTNFSLRAFAAEGDRTLILGFALDGSGAKPLVIRGIGPGLAEFGVAGTLADPRLAVYEGSTQTLGNDNWSGTDGHTIGGFELAPGSKDAVLLGSFAARAFTSQVAGAAGTSGEALAELYDADTSNTGLRLVNLSARTTLGDGQRLIVGFTITGDTSKTWIMRVIGPTLATFGLSTAHPDPRLELYSGATKVAENDQWAGDDGRGSGAFPLPSGSKDAVVVRSLAPGGYTAHVLGPTGTSGIVLVEIYEAR